MEKVVKLKPSIKSYIWGGNYFKQFDKGDAELLSELWELSVRGDDSCFVASGKDLGKRLDQVITNEDVGPISEQVPYFPLLIKLIDAKDNLSVQVHPSDDYALEKYQSYGKNEMWHIISAEPGCGLYVGFNKDYTKEEIKEKLEKSEILDALNFFEVKPGDTFMIKAGTIHAIGKGVRLIEIQQNSDLTFRLYDYLRKDKNGNYRPLHIQEALNVINYHRFEKEDSGSSVLADNKYFHVERKEVDGELELEANNNSFISFTFLSGEGLVDDIPYKIYDSFFLPHGKKCKIKGKGIVIISSLWYGRLFKEN